MTTVPRCKGSYFQRKNGSYQVKYPLGFNANKKRYDEYREEVGCEAEAIALIKAINDFTYHGGAVADVPAWRRGKEAEEKARAITVSELGEEFIAARESGSDKGKGGLQVEERTIENYRTCRNQIAPYLGNVRIIEVTRDSIESVLNAMQHDGPDNLNGRVYTGTTLQKTHSYLNLIFKWAVKKKYIDRFQNPMSEVERPRNDTREKMPLTQEQAHELYSALAKKPLDAIRVGVLICLFCGVRQSEMLALRWMDYEDGRIDVSKSLRRKAGKPSFKTTKTKEKRTVPCPPALMRLLALWQTEQREWYVAHDLDWSEDAPIVNSSRGEHVKQSTFMKWIRENRAEYPVPDNFTSHVMRHTYVSFLDVDVGAARSTSKSMSGHKSDHAFGIYSHTNIDAMRRAAYELGDIIAPEEDVMCCFNCSLWTESPTNTLKGACWANEAAPVVTDSVCQCDNGLFSMRKRIA